MPADFVQIFIAEKCLIISEGMEWQAGGEEESSTYADIIDDFIIQLFLPPKLPPNDRYS